MKSLLCIAPHDPAVLLIHKSGSVTRYASLAKAYQALGYTWLSQHLGEVFSEGCLLEHAPYYVPAVAWIMRTEHGEVITLEDFESFRPTRLASSFWYRRFRFYSGTGPVPGCGRRRGGRWFRRPKTMQSRRQAGLVLNEEDERPVRARRNAANLPTSWDDWRISSLEDRNWKRFRKTQYKQKR